LIVLAVVRRRSAPGGVEADASHVPTSGPALRLRLTVSRGRKAG